MINRLSAALQEKVDTIIDNAGKQLFSMGLQLISSNSNNVNLEVEIIDEMQIDQLFTNNFTDSIEVTIKLPPADYMNLVNNNKDLIAALTFTYIDPDTYDELYDKAPLCYRFKCVLKNPVDLTKKYHLSEILPDEEGSMEYEGHHSMRIETILQLIDDNIYVVRKAQVNFMLGNTTVDNVITYAANMFNITKMYMEDIDNTVVREHYIVSPPKDFSTLFDYIQETYGVYNKGLEYYYTNGTLFVYPPYEVNPDRPTTINIYNVPYGRYGGLKGYHVYEGKDIHIVSNSEVETKNLNEIGIENDGNSTMYARADTMIDDFREVTNSNGTQIKENNIISSDLLSSKSMVSDTIVPKYNAPTTNIYAQTSALFKNDATLIMLGWVHAIPFSIEPGQKVLYHFDDDGQYNYKTGRCEKVVYSIDKVDRGKEQLYTCSATMLIRIEPT